MLEYDPHAWVALCQFGKLRQPLLARRQCQRVYDLVAQLADSGGVLTAVIAARFITSIKEPEALTFNSNAWFGGARSFLARVTMCI